LHAGVNGPGGTGFDPLPWRWRLSTKGSPFFKINIRSRKMAKLNQILAIEKSKKTALHDEITELHKATQKPSFVNGHYKTFAPIADDGETFPDDVHHVQCQHGEVISQVVERLAILMDVTATKDFANCNARADIIVGGEVFLKSVPVHYLLFLEKELKSLETFVTKMVVLAPSENWVWDPHRGLFRSQEPVKTHKTKKMQRPIVLYPATDKHPAQTNLITDDVIIGYWSTTNLSGAIPREKKVELLARIRELQDAVKFAREHANSTEAPEQKVGRKVLDFIFSQA